jgi:hypothetical protein
MPRRKKLSMDDFNTSDDINYTSRELVVQVESFGLKDGMGEMIKVAIERRDGLQVDYDTRMQVKDIFIGSDAEAVELYPRRDREVDLPGTVLWGFAKFADTEAYRWPFGYNVKVGSRV